jgi:hypothetical protein
MSVVSGIDLLVATEQKARSQQWPEPEPINASLLPVEELPKEIIPAPFREWVADVAYRMQCPIDFIAVAVMIITGAVIGSGCGIKPKKKDDWLVIPNMWGGIIGRPGMLKTPALQEAMKPLTRLEVEAKKQYDSDLVYFETEKEAFKAKKEAVKAEMISAAKGKGTSSIEDAKNKYAALEQPAESIWRRFKTNDATIEKMAELMQQNSRGILLFRDELVGLLTSWDKDGREPDRAFFLEAWNGNGCATSDRIGRGTVHVNNLCVSLLEPVQKVPI